MITYNIHNQKDFEEAPLQLLTSIQKKEDTDYQVFLDDGQYYFTANQFFLFIGLNDYSESEKISLQFDAAKGSKGSVKIAAADDSSWVQMEGLTPPYTSHLHAFITTQKKKYKWYQKLFKCKKSTSAPDYPSLWADSFYDAKDVIEVVDEKTKTCRLTYNGDLKKLFGSDYKNFNLKNRPVYINVTQWYKSNVYQVTDIDFDNNTIDFICTDLTYNDSKKQWSINYDYIYSKAAQYPKFRLSNFNGQNTVNLTKGANGVEIQYPKNVQAVHECTYTNFLYIKNCDCFKYVEIQNITFNGNALTSDAVNTNKNSALIFVEDSAIGEWKPLLLSATLNGLLYIHKCKFENIYSNVITTYDVKGWTIIESNKFSKCWRYGIYALSRNVIHKTSEAFIKDNSFDDCGLAYTNTFCVRCDCADYSIVSNTFHNYGYAGIASGTWYKTENEYLPNGSISYNKLQNDKNYIIPLMDSGAIYLHTKHDKVEVEQNTIKNYEGRKDNRGIFCDDGAYNFTLHDNTISNTPNSFSIDARRVASSDSYCGELGANRSNTIRENTFDNNIRFEGNVEYINNDTLGCVLGTNYRTKNVDTYSDVINDLYAGNEACIVLKK